MDTAMAKDYYEVLGVSRNSTKEEIRQAFRRLARQLHPDINKAPDAEAQFKEINEAHEVLSDDEKRARYDRFGHAGVTGVGGGAGAAGYGFEEIFEEFMNNFAGARTSARRRGPRPGGERHVDVIASKSAKTVMAAALNRAQALRLALNVGVRGKCAVYSRPSSVRWYRWSLVSVAVDAVKSSLLPAKYARAMDACAKPTN
jgi:DnaJ-class molecular chaperone